MTNNPAYMDISSDGGDKSLPLPRVAAAAEARSRSSRSFRRGHRPARARPVSASLCLTYGAVESRPILAVLCVCSWIHITLLTHISVYCSLKSRAFPTWFTL